MYKLKFAEEIKLKDILNYESFSTVEPIHKGWSNDKKYYVETKSGEKLLLRVSDISEYEEKKHEFELMKRISDIGINMSKPIDFGVCNGGKHDSFIGLGKKLRGESQKVPGNI